MHNLFNVFYQSGIEQNLESIIESVAFYESSCLFECGIEPLQFYPISYKFKRIFQKTLHPSLLLNKSLGFNKLLEWRVVLTLHHPSLPFTGSILRVRSSGRSSTPTTIKDYRKTINFCNPQKLDFNAVKGSEGLWRVETTLHPYKTLTLNNLHPKSEGWRVFGSSAI